MVDAALIQQCADKTLKPAIVERFIATAGSENPLAITVRAGGRVVLVPPPKSADEALALVRRYVGQAVVRVGITQYPAGVGVTDASQLTADLIDPCKNVRMGTALFAKVYRIVVKWYGAAVPEAFDDAISAWRTGTFEGKAVFLEPDPGELDVTSRDLKPSAGGEEGRPPSGETSQHAKTRGEGRPAEPRRLDEDPRRAEMRINLTRTERDRNR